MTALLTILRMAWPYLLTAAAGGFISHEIDQIPYERLQTSFSSYKAQVAAANAQAQKAASDALQAQIQTRLTTEANNGKVIAQLQSERDGAVADAQFARRLLAAAQALPTTPSHPGASTPGGSGADDPAGSSGDRPLAQELELAAGECRAAIQRLAALQAELGPQLTR